MNLTGGNDGVVSNGGRGTAPWRAEVAYVRRDSFWIEHEGDLDGTSQSTAPIFVEDRSPAADRGGPAQEGPFIAGELEIPTHGWAKLSSPLVLALTAAAFAMGIGVSPLVRSPRPPAPAPVSVAPAAPPPPAAPAVLPAPPAPAAAACAADGAEGATTEPPPVAHASARAAASRSRSSSGLGSSNPVWSSRHHQKKAAAVDAAPAPETTPNPDDAEAPAVKPAEKQIDGAPAKKDGAPAMKKESPAKKPAAKAWVDPWAGAGAPVRAG